MQELLESWGLTVSAWRDSAAVAAHFEAHPDCCDLALLDQTMPRLTGLELAQHLRAHAPALPVVLKADARAQYDKVMEVLERAKALDITEIGLVTKRAGA